MGKVDGLRAIGKILDDIAKAFRGPPPAFKPKPGPAPTLPQPTKPPPQPPPRRPIPFPPSLDGGEGTDPLPSPQTAPEPGGQPLPNSSAQSDPACEECDDEECPPRTQGKSVKRHYDVDTNTQKVGYAYQNSICPWHAHDPINGTIEEWEFGGVTYDCLHPTQCLLIETKHGYDGFLEQKDWTASGRPQLREWARKAKVEVFEEMIKQAEKQRDIAFSTTPPSRVKWVFSESITEIYVFERFLEEELWMIEVETR